MALVSMRELLDHAAENSYGIPAFNVNNLEQVQAVMSAADEVGAPVILQASAGARKYAGESFIKHLVQAAVEAYPHIPVVMHQDHGQSPAICQGAIHLGFSSVMMDGSLKEDGKTPADFDYNVRVTREVVDLALREMLAKYRSRRLIALRGKGLIDPRYDVRSVRLGETQFSLVMVDSVSGYDIEMTGDRLVTGRLRECDQSRLMESLGSASLGEVLGDSVTRRMLAEYRAAVDFDGWRQLVNVVPVSDFRMQHRTRWGGYGDLPTVAEGADYQPLTSPGDEEATYKAGKKGGTEDITLEMIKNDDVGTVRRIPTKLSRAAKRTLAKFVFDFLRTNPVIYDTKALFHVDHANLFAAALSKAELAIHRLAMLKQTELSSNDRIGIAPSRLVVPSDLQAWRDLRGSLERRQAIRTLGRRFRQAK